MNPTAIATFKRAKYQELHYKYSQGNLVNLEDHHLNKLADQILDGIDGTCDVIPFFQFLQLARLQFEEHLSEIRLVVIIARSKNFQVVELNDSPDSAPVPYIWDLRKVNQKLKAACSLPIMANLVNGTVEVNSMSPNHN